MIKFSGKRAPINLRGVEMINNKGVIYTEKEIMELFDTLDIYVAVWEDSVCSRELTSDQDLSYNILESDQSLDVAIIKGKATFYYRIVDLISILNNKYDEKLESEKKCYPDIYKKSKDLVDFLLYTELNKVPLYLTDYPQLANWRLKISK